MEVFVAVFGAYMKVRQASLLRRGLSKASPGDTDHFENENGECEHEEDGFGGRAVGRFQLREMQRDRGSVQLPGILRAPRAWTTRWPHL